MKTQQATRVFYLRLHGYVLGLSKQNMGGFGNTTLVKCLVSGLVCGVALYDNKPAPLKICKLLEILYVEV